MGVPTIVISEGNSTHQFRKGFHFCGKNLRS